jgi:hypothetical protein
MRESAVIPLDFLPRSIIGRATLFVQSAGTVVFAGIFLYSLAIGPGGGTWGEGLIRIGLGEFFASLFATGWAGLLWSVATPGWLRAVAWRAGRWTAVCLLIPWAILLGLLLWPW